MPRRPVEITQAFIQRAIRAAKKEGLRVVVVQSGGARVIMPLLDEQLRAFLADSTQALPAPQNALEDSEDIVL